MTEQLNIGIGHRNFFARISEHRSFYTNRPFSSWHVRWCVASHLHAVWL